MDCTVVLGRRYQTGDPAELSACGADQLADLRAVAMSAPPLSSASNPRIITMPEPCDPMSPPVAGRTWVGCVVVVGRQQAWVRTVGFDRGDLMGAATIFRHLSDAAIGAERGRLDGAGKNGADEQPDCRKCRRRHKERSQRSSIPGTCVRVGVWLSSGARR